MLDSGVSRLTSRPAALEPATATDERTAPAPSAPATSIIRPAPEPDLRWDLLLWCVAGYLLTSVGRVHQLFPVLEALRPAVLSGLLAIVIYLADRREERRANLLWVRTTKCLIALLVWMVLSVPGALVDGTSFDLVFDDFVKTVLMYLVVAGAVRGPRDVERLSVVYLIAATVYAGVVISRFAVGSGDDWRLGHLYYYDANDFATFAVTAMPLGLYFLHSPRGTLARLLAVAALAVLTLAFVRTGSRGGFVALVAVIAFVVARYTVIALRWRIAATALVTVVVLGAASDQYWQQMSTILSDADYNRTDESGRLQIWSRGVGYMLQYPILGVGPNNFQAAEGMLSPFSDRQQFGIGVRWNAPHNSYIQAGAELGLPGLVIFISLIASGFGALRRSSPSQHALAGGVPTVAPGSPTRRRWRGPPALRRPGAGDTSSQLAQALTASLIGFVVGAFFLSLAYSQILYTLVALAVGLQKVTVGLSDRRV
jgi:putative inorganic carbon (HCO3(-)) transporter